MALTANIEPTVIYQPAVTLRIDNTMLTFGSGEGYARCTATLFDVDGFPLKLESVGLTEEELANWGDDDSVLISIVLAKLGLSETL